MYIKTLCMYIQIATCHFVYLCFRYRCVSLLTLGYVLITSNLLTNEGVAHAIKTMKMGKSPGVDGLSCEYMDYIFVDDKLHYLLCRFINATTVHRYVPVNQNIRNCFSANYERYYRQG